MTGHAVRRAFWLLLFPLAALAQSPQGGFSPETTHTVRPGETLWGISGKYLGRPLLWPGVQQSNRVGEPRSLQIGRLLRFAGDEREAFVLAVIGDVRGAQGQPLTLGTRLPEGALVRTGPDSFITLRLPDGSRTTLPSNSTVRLVRFFDDGGKSAVLLDL
ncbi:MAG: LysM peptidoglycan-binding domain-containing protein, partial [Variovorax sp.]